MGKRRSENPLTILIMGFVAMGIFGGAVVHFSRSTPVLKLRPELERELGRSPIATQFLPPRPPQTHTGTVRVVLPARDGDTPGALLEIAALALRRYREIAVQTIVDTCIVSSGPQGLEVSVNLSQAAAIEQARAALPHLARRLEGLGVHALDLQVVGVAQDRVRLALRGAVLTARKAEPVATDALRLLTRQPFVGEVELELTSPEGALERRAGRDVRGALPPRRAPPRRGGASVAPVRTG